MLRLLFDENFDHRILRGLRLRIQDLDFLAVQEMELKGQSDQRILAWAAQNQRILVTHDVNTIPQYMYQRIRKGGQVTGVIIVPDDLAVGIAIEELAFLIECCEAGELAQKVIYLPL